MGPSPYVADLNQNRTFSASFTTGSLNHGYHLQSIEFKVRVANGVALTSNEVARIRAELWSAGRKVRDLTVPADVASGDTTVFAAPQNTWLRPNTTYQARLYVTSALSRLRLLVAATTDENPGSASGWSIGDQSTTFSGPPTNPGGVTPLATASGVASLQIRVNRLAPGGDGTLDDSFGGFGQASLDLHNVLADFEGRAMAVQSDGKFVVAGNSDGDFAVVRFNADGSLDADFGAGGMATTAVGSGSDEAQSVAIGSDGDIVVAGYSHNGSNNDFAVVVYDSDGEPESDFSTDGIATTAVGSGNDFGRAVAVQSDGKIVVAGSSGNGSNQDFAVVRYNADGTLDTGFSTDGKQTTGIGLNDDVGYAVAVDGNGRIIVAGSASNGSNDDFAVVRYTANGALDKNFSTSGKKTFWFGSGNDSAQAVALDGDGNIVVAGYGKDSTPDFAVARLTSTGVLDTDFDSDGQVLTNIGPAGDFGRAVAVQTDGKIVVAGHRYTTSGNKHDFALVRYNTDGSLDTGFSGDGKQITVMSSGENRAQAVALSGGKIVAAGYARNALEVGAALARYNTDGSLDTGFDSDGKATTLDSREDEARAVALQADGKIVIAGSSHNGSNDDFAVVRYDADGELDTDFGEDGWTTTEVGSAGDFGRAVAVQPDGKIVVAGNSYNGSNQDVAVVRYDAGGDLDTGFGTGGKVTTAIGSGNDYGRAVALQSDGKIVVAGESDSGSGNWDIAVLRYNADGTLDTGFGMGGKVTTAIGAAGDFGYALALQSDGKIVVAGNSYNGSDQDIAVVRYNADGTLDTSFHSDGKVTTGVGSGNDYGRAVAIDGNGKIVVVGESDSGSGNWDVAVVRFKSNGALDADFGTSGIVTTAVGSAGDFARAVAVDKYGKIVVAGNSYNGSNQDFVVLRYNVDGTLDDEFGYDYDADAAPDGYSSIPFGPGDDVAQALALEPSGKIVVAGYTENGENKDFALARFQVIRSANADLSALTVQASEDNADFSTTLTLDPTFAADTTGYRAVVANAVTHVKLTPTVDDTGKATLRLGAGGELAPAADAAASDAIALGVGENVLTVEVTADDNTTKAYTVRIYRHAEGLLVSNFGEPHGQGAAQTLNNRAWAQGFTTGGDSEGYPLGGISVRLFNAPTSAQRDTIRAELWSWDNGPEEKLADLKVPEHPIATGAVQFAAPPDTVLDHDTKYFFVVYTAGSYNMQMAYTASADEDAASASGWSIFDRSHTAISASRPDASTSWAPLNTAILSIVVDGTIPSSDATLRALAAGGHTSSSGIFGSVRLRPAFDPATTAYRTTVPNGTTHAKLIANANHPYATLEVGKAGGLAAVIDGAASDAIALDVGDNEIQVVATAEDGTTSTYTVTITRQAAPSGDSIVLVSNLDMGNIYGNVSATSLAQRFVTGSTPSTLTSIRMRVLDLGTSQQQQTIRAELWDASRAQGHPGTKLADLTLSTTQSSVNTAVFTAPVGTRLAANTDYNLVIYTVGGYDLGPRSKPWTGSYAARVHNWHMPAASVWSTDDVPTPSSSWMTNSDRWLLIQISGLLPSGDGTLDYEFAESGQASLDLRNVREDFEGRATAVQSDGKLVVAGYRHNGVNRDFAVIRFNANGSVDTDFGTGGIATTQIGFGDDEAQAVALDASGNIVVAGSSWNGSNHDVAVVVYDSDGELETDFSSDGKVVTGVGSGNDFGRAVALQSDGKIVVAGYSHNGSNHDFAAVRYHADGSLDNTFGDVVGDGVRSGRTTSAVGSGHDYGQALALDANGNIVVAGYSRIGSTDDFAVVRYDSDGELDADFDSNGMTTTAIGSAGDFGRAVAVQSDGKIVVAGNSSNGANQDFAVVRYDSDGSLDTGFDTDGMTTTAIGSAGDFGRAVVVRSDGKIVVAGNSYNGRNHDFAVVSYNADGSLDTGFDTDGKVTTGIGIHDEAHAVALDADGKIVAAGFARTKVEVSVAVARYNTDGSLDRGFSTDGKVDLFDSRADEARAVAVQSDGKIVVAGSSSNGSNDDFAVVRYHADGTLDTDFGTGGRVTTRVRAGRDVAHAVAVQSDGKIVVAGHSWASGSSHDFAVVRYNEDGSLDAGFSGDGKVFEDVAASAENYARAVAVQSDGKIMVAGQSRGNQALWSFALVRFNADGSKDNSFGTNGEVYTGWGNSNAYARAMALQSDGKIVVAGDRHNGSDHDFTVARYNTNGTLDTSFGTGGRVTTAVGSGNDFGRAVAVAPDGKIVVVGESHNGSNFDIAVVRYNADGSLDTAFGTGGQVVTAIGAAGDFGRAVAVDEYGRIVVAGNSYNGSNQDFVVLRYNVDGTLDDEFGYDYDADAAPDGYSSIPFGPGNDVAQALALQPDRNIVVAGYSENGGNKDFALARFAASELELGTYTFSPNSYTVPPATTFSIYVDLSAPAPAGGLELTLTPLFGAANLPSGFCPTDHAAEILAEADDIGSNPPTTVTVAAGQTRAKFDYPVADNDDLVFQQECFGLELGTSAPGWTAGSAPVAKLVIEETLAKIGFGSSAGATAKYTATVAETVSGGTLTVPVTVDRLPYRSLTIAVQVQTASTATEGTDFSISTKSVTFGPNTAKTRNLSVTITDDDAAEGDETIELRIAPGSLNDGSLGGAFQRHAQGSRATITIQSEDVGAPANLKVGAQDGQLGLSWTAPTITGGSALSGYDVHYTSAPKTGSNAVLDDAAVQTGSNPSAADGWVDASHSGTTASDELTGLSNGTEYRVRVRAVTAAGSSAWTQGAGTPTATASSNADLSALTATSAASASGTYTALTLTPAFAAATTSYTASVANSISHAKLTPTAADAATAAIKVGKQGTTLTAVNSGSASAAIALDVGANALDVEVTAQDGTSKTYTVTITRASPPSSSNADLSGLTASNSTSAGGTYSALALTPAFAAATTSYTASVANSISHAKLTPTAADAANAAIKVGKQGKTLTAVTSGSASAAISLDVGANALDVEVTAQDGTSKTYTVTITRASPPSSSNADLSGLTASNSTSAGGTYSALALTPAFAGGTTSYTASVANSISHAKLTPTAADAANASIKVGKQGTTLTVVTSGSASAAIALDVGANALSVEVTAQDGTSKTYTVTITRASPPTNTPTVSLSASPNPVAEGSSVTVTATLSAALSSSVRIPLTLTAGTAESGDYGTLAAITIAAGQTTGTGVIRANQDADDDDETFSVALDAANLPSTVAAGSPSSVALTITDDDQLSVNANLGALAVSAGESATGRFASLTLTPSTFNAATTSYTATVSSTISHAKLTPTVEDRGKATVQVGKAGGMTTVTSGRTSAAIPLDDGANLITVRVTAEDGAATREYTVRITRTPRPTVSLSASPNPVPLPAHDPDGPDPPTREIVTITATLSQALPEVVWIPVTTTRGPDHSGISRIGISANSLSGAAQIRVFQDIDTDDDTFTVALDTAQLPREVAPGAAASVTVTIEDRDSKAAPGPLANFTVTPRFRYLQLNWDRPSARTTHYDIQFKTTDAPDQAGTGMDPTTGWLSLPKGGTWIPDLTERRVTITPGGLPTGTAYDVRVRAVNWTAAGPWATGRGTPK